MATPPGSPGSPRPGFTAWRAAFEELLALCECGGRECDAADAAMARAAVRVHRARNGRAWAPPLFAPRALERAAAIIDAASESDPGSRAACYAADCLVAWGVKVDYGKWEIAACEPLLG